MDISQVNWSITDGHRTVSRAAPPWPAHTATTAHVGTVLVITMPTITLVSSYME